MTPSHVAFDPGPISEPGTGGDFSTLIGVQARKLWAMQHDDGHLVFDVEADSTIPAEYVLLRHFLGQIDAVREARIARYLLARQSTDGSWPLYQDGPGNISTTIKSYWALKLIGEQVASPHMTLARDWVLAQGGAANANVFTRFSMALFGQIPWRGVPTMPVECVLLPRWFPFHMSKISYWSRTVLTPLLILYALRATAVNPTGRDIAELFTVPPEQQKRYQINPTGSLIGQVFLALDPVLRVIESRLPGRLRRRAIRQAEAFVLSHLNGEHGLGAIYPAMANAVMALRALGYSEGDQNMKTATQAVENLLVEKDGESFFQPCVSPVWDTSLAAHALLESGDRDDPRMVRALDWLADKQILDHVGDWAARRPDLRPGGWAFQYENPDYPDVDDTAVVAMAMHRADPRRYAMNIERACEWMAGMQSKTGGWGAFDPENEHYYLNAIPFADHGALLDPPTVDVTARCVGALAQVDATRFADAIRRGIGFIKREQEPDGSWYGRWGCNYIYGTWSALVALKGAGEDMDQAYIRRAVDWLKDRQHADGGWGETMESYESAGAGLDGASVPSQTAWALLGLMSAGKVDSDCVDEGVEWLHQAPRDAEGPRWQETKFTGTGFPRIFYLKYHGYAAYFPLWALARHAGLMKSNERDVKWGI